MSRAAILVLHLLAVHLFGLEEDANGSSLSSPGSSSANESNSPNVIVILSDDMGFSDLGCYGGEIHTPHLDQMAAQGLRFSQFYNGARCCPTRAALMSGVYPHQTGVGLMTADHNLPGYRGELGRHVLTLAELLTLGGYRSYMSGKWHLTKHIQPEGPKDNWPLRRGFEAFYGTIIGAGSFFDPATLCRGETYITPRNDPEYNPSAFYYTDAISDNAIRFLRQHHDTSADSPFFLYVAYTTAHWPMHAWPEDIAKYKGRYDAGYDAIRAKRLERLRNMGLVSASTRMSPMAERWEDVEDKAWEARCMEVYAAMVESMDRGIGRIVDEVRRQGSLDQTLIFYLQDNGGCAEGFGRQAPKKPYRTDYEPLGRDGLQDKIWPPMQTRDGRPVRVGPGVMAGPEDTFIGYGRGWANVSNTPFREYKHWSHEGGIATPLIVHWPEGISVQRRGEIEHQPGHVIDIMATCVDVAGIEYPGEFDGRAILPLEGTSLRPSFNRERLQRRDALYFEHHLNCAIRDGRWKLVRKGVRGKDPRLFDWELYDMQADRSELEDLADEFPDRVRALEEKWEAWAIRAKVKPWPYDVD